MLEKLINTIKTANQLEYCLNDGLIDEGYFAILVENDHHTILVYWGDIKELSIEDHDSLVLYKGLNHSEQNDFRLYIENKFGVEIKRIF